jgi:ATP-dependent exoDNAse (exonuclease V) alpha subunit
VVFGVAPTAKAARVLESETGMGSDTVAKLLHEWRRTDRPPERPWRLPAGATVIVDEAGMINTGDLHQLTHLADAPTVAVGVGR